MAKIVKQTDLGKVGDDGWKVVYEIERDDGEVVTADLGCTRSAAQTAAAQGNVKALESMRHFGGIDVVGIAEKVQSPARRGATHIVAYYDNIDGSFTWSVSYERDL